MHHAAAHHTCTNCHNNFKGNYCNQCGEKVYTEHDKKISHLFEEAVHFSTHFDNRFFRTLKWIFVKPGFVSKEFCEGKRKKYYSPFSLFLLAVVLYLLFPRLQGLNISFANHLHNNKSIGVNLPAKWAVAKASGEYISVEKLGEKFDHLSPKIAKVLLVIIIPLCGLAFSLLFREKKKYFFDHFILSAEFNSSFILYIFFAIPLLFTLFSLFVPIHDIGDSNPIFGALQLAVLWTIAAAAIRRFYNTRLVTAVWTSLLYLVMHSFIVFLLYRFILFTIVMLLI